MYNHILRPYRYPYYLGISALREITTTPAPNGFYNPDQTCPICLDTFESSEGEVLKFKCGHGIHKACNKSLYKCPVCRAITGEGHAPTLPTATIKGSHRIPIGYIPVDRMPLRVPITLKYYDVRIDPPEEMIRMLEELTREDVSNSIR